MSEFEKESKVSWISGRPRSRGSCRGPCSRR